MNAFGAESERNAQLRTETIDIGGIHINRLSRPAVTEAEGRRGPAAPKPVLLLHGWPQDCEMWRPTIERLRPDRRIEAPDLRGFGRSSSPGHGYDAPTFAADQIDLMDRIGIDSAHVVGHDWGGWTAWHLALGHPARIESITVINAPHLWPRLWPPPVTQIPRSWYALLLALPFAGPRLLRSGTLTRRMLDWGSNRKLGPDSIARYTSAFADEARADTATKLYRHYVKAFIGAGSRRWGREHLHVPAQILFGKRDRMIDYRLIEHGFREHGGARIELFPEHGHFLPDEAPDIVADRAQRLWDECESA